MQRNKKGQFIKGCISWCKGTKGIIKSWNKGLTVEQDSRILSGDKNGMFGVHRFGKDAPNYIKVSKKELYNLYWNKELNQIKIGKIFNCSPATIKNKLIKYNIPRRTLSESFKRRPSPFKGKHHNKEAIEQIREKNLGRKQLSTTGNKNPAKRPEVRAKMSKQRKGRKLAEDWKRKIKESCQGINQGKENGMFGKTPKYERIRYNNIWMRSSYEIKFAYFLDLSGYKWLYEPKTFNLGNTTYTPDFYLPNFNCYIEIKGYWYKGSKERFNLFKKLYPKIKIEVLTEPELQSMGVLE